MANTNSGPLSFEAYLTTTDFKKGLDDLERRIVGSTAKIASEGQKIDDVYRKLGGTIGAVFAANQMQDFANQIVNVRGQFQQLDIAFTTMLKSKSRADALMGQIVDFAAKNPFDLSQIATGAKQLLAYGSAAESVIDEIRMLGDVSAGVSAPLNDIVYLYGTLRTQGRAYATDIRQFAGRGIPIYEELGKVLNRSTEEVNQFVEAGKVGFKEVEQAFKNMTGAGGLFEGLTEKQAASLTGLLSNFKDAVDRMFNDMGKQNEGTIADIIKGATSVVDNYQEVVDILKVLIGTYGAYRAAVIATIAIQSLSSLASAISLYASLAKNIRNAKDAMIFLNLVTNQNPWVILASAIAAVTIGIMVFSNETKKAADTTELLADAQKQVMAGVAKEKAEITTLVNVLKNQNLAESVRLEAYNKINAVTPEILKGLDFTKAKTADLTKEVNNYVAALEKKLRLEVGNEKFKIVLDKQADAQQKYADALEKLNELEKNRKQAGFKNDLTGIDVTDYSKGDKLLLQYREDVKNTFKAFRDTQSDVDKVRLSIEKTAGLTAKELIESQINDIKAIMSITNKFDPEYKKLEEQMKGLQSKLKTMQPQPDELSFTEKLAEANDIGRLKLLKTLKKTDQEYSDYVEKIQSVRAPFKQGTKEYNQFTQLLNEVKKQNKELTSGDEPAPMGSLAYWEKVSQEYLNLMNRLDPAKDTSKIEDYKKKRIDAEQKISELRAKYENKTFEQSLEEKKKAYADFNQWTSLKGKEVADKDYQYLLASGKSYQDYITKEIAKVESKINTNTSTAQDRENLLKLKSEDVRIFEEGIEEKKKRYELYNKWVLTYGKESADKEFKDLIAQGNDYKTYLQNEIKSIEARIKAAPALEDQNKLITIKNAYEIETEGLDKYKKRIEETADLLGSLTEQIEFFNNEQAKISPFDIDRTLFLVGLRLQAEKERKKLLAGYLVETNTFELKRLEIEKHFNDLRAQLDKDMMAGRIASNKQALDRINADEQAALVNLKEFEANEILNRSKAYNEMQKILFLPDDDVLRFRIEKLKAALGELESKNMTGTETYKKQLMELIEMQDQLVDSNIQHFTRIGNVFANIDSEAGGLIGTIGKIGKNFSALSSYAKRFSELAKTIKKTDAAIKTAGSPEEALAAGVLGKRALNVQAYTLALEMLVDTFGKLSRAIEEHKKRQSDFYNSAITQQNEYNKLLNEELLAKSDKYFFSADPFTKINDAIAAGKDIITDYNAAFNKLVEIGKVITKPAGIWIWSKDKTAALFKEYPDLINEAINTLGHFDVARAKSLLSASDVTDETKKQLQIVIDYVEQYEETQDKIKQSITDITGQIGQDLKNALVDAFKSGESAALAFSNTFSKVIENMITEAAYTAILKPLIDKLGEEFQASYARDEYGNPTGDMNLVDDIKRNLDPIKEGSDAFYKELQAAAELINKEFGLDIFKNGDGKTLSGAIQTITEDTAGILAGQMNAIRITQAQTQDIIRNQLLALNKIAVNSDFLPYLESIDKKIGKLVSSNDIRAGGF